jgi:hypothetical protein
MFYQDCLLLTKNIQSIILFYMLRENLKIYVCKLAAKKSLSKSSLKKLIKSFHDSQKETFGLSDIQATAKTLQYARKLIRALKA